jgi:hypothetical protein
LKGEADDFGVSLLKFGFAHCCALRIADPHPLSVLSEKLGGKRRTIIAIAVVEKKIATSLR